MRPSLAFLAVAVLGTSAIAQHSQVSSVATNPNDSTEVWVCNRGNDSVSVIDTTTGTTTNEIDVGVWPRSLAFSADGSTVFVANQRGNVAVDVNFVTPFAGTELRGTISVIDVATKTETQQLTDVGTEPYGVAVSPNGNFFAVSGHRSGTIKLYDAQSPYALLATHQYARSMNDIASGTIADVDTNVDMIPDLDEARAFVITSDSTRMFVTHALPGYVSVLDITLDGGGLPTGIAQNTKIDLNEYPFHPIFNPVNVQNVASQGVPRFLDDIALSPDGTRALVPHLLHNINHDVNHDFAGEIAGDFANRVYPALTVVDAANLSYGQGGDTSARVHHEIADPAAPAEYVPYGGQGVEKVGGIYTLGGTGYPSLGGTVDLEITGGQPGDTYMIGYGNAKVSIPLGPFGTQVTNASFGIIPIPGPSLSAPLPGSPGVIGMSFYVQAGVFGPTLKGLTNGLQVFVSDKVVGGNDMGYRAGHPGRVLFSPDGSHAVLLNRGSEDVFLYEVNGSSLSYRTAFPPRKDFVERAAFDATTPMGDLPLGMALVDDPSTVNDDSLLYVVNETSRTLSSLRIDWATGVITKEASQIPTLLGADKMTLSERTGQELFEDASRAQTSGNFNNSCTSCHFEGGADGNIWQRPAGPRTTMPVYGGPLLTGLILWKGVRLHLGETGPMFGGENGGGGVLSDTEQIALIDYHKIIPVPLNPNLDPVTGAYSLNAEFGEDLFFGSDNTGLNPSGRHAGCFTCHPKEEETTFETRGYTTDFVLPLLTDDIAGLETIDPTCVSLQENIVGGPNIRNINSGVNIDIDDDGIPEPDRNFDGWNDLETYAVLNVDTNDDFTRDDTNSYMCPEGGIPGNPLKVFMRSEALFVVPTKLGVFSSGPYMHDHSLASLRMVLDPGLQQTDPTYGNALYPSVQKFFNEFHDARGHEDFVVGASKVQTTLLTFTTPGATIDGDIQALLEYISSL